MPDWLMRTSSMRSVDGELDFELLGNFRFSALGETREEVNMKKISSRKMMSVREDILNSALTLLLFFSPIVHSGFGLGCDDGIDFQPVGRFHH